MGAIAVVVVAYAANSFQADLNQSIQASQNRMTGMTLQSQREQAESNLRAAMFSSLIQPFAHPEKDDRIPVDREQLLAELLVLNFNEDFEAKPLLHRVDTRLATERPSMRERVSVSEHPREALRSIARRVADRQISALSSSWIQATSAEQTTSVEHGCETYWLNLAATPKLASVGTSGNTLPEPLHCTMSSQLGERISLISPDGKSRLTMWVMNPDWDNQTVRVSVDAVPLAPVNEQQHIDHITYAFTLTWFDLPLTDNTVLSNGNRFAINLRGVDKDTRSVSLRVIWFPPRFFTPRERPLDFREILGLLQSSDTSR
jgi:hypothetical protein